MECGLEQASVVTAVVTKYDSGGSAPGCSGKQQAIWTSGTVRRPDQQFVLARVHSSIQYTLGVGNP